MATGGRVPTRKIGLYTLHPVRQPEDVRPNEGLEARGISDSRLLAGAVTRGRARSRPLFAGIEPTKGATDLDGGTSVALNRCFPLDKPRGEHAVEKTAALRVALAMWQTGNVLERELTSERTSYAG